MAHFVWRCVSELLDCTWRRRFYTSSVLGVGASLRAGHLRSDIIADTSFGSLRFGVHAPPLVRAVKRDATWSEGAIDTDIGG